MVLLMVLNYGVLRSVLRRRRPQRLLTVDLCVCVKRFIKAAFSSVRCRTEPRGGRHHRVFVLQCQLRDREDQSEWGGALRGREGQTLALLRLLEEQLGLHRAGEEGLLAGRLQLLRPVLTHTHTLTHMLTQIRLNPSSRAEPD